jgi:hypothetical protein
MSPNNRTLAFVVSSTTDSQISEDYSLYFVRLPNIDPVLLSPLFAQTQLDNIATHFPEADPLAYEKGTASYLRHSVAFAITQQHSIAWSPDGRYLAFVAALDGVTTDLYVFDTDSNTVSRISYGPSTYATRLMWSPDGRYVIHQAVADFNLGRSGGYNPSSLWASSLNGTQPALLLEGPTEAIGWISSRYLMAVLWMDLGCGAYNLVLIDVPLARYTTLWRGPVEIDFPREEAFTVQVPPQADAASLDPQFLSECQPPDNPASTIDLDEVPELPPGYFQAAQTDGVTFRVDNGKVSFSDR